MGYPWESYTYIYTYIQIYITGYPFEKKREIHRAWVLYTIITLYFLYTKRNSLTGYPLIGSGQVFMRSNSST